MDGSTFIPHTPNVNERMWMTRDTKRPVDGTGLERETGLEPATFSLGS